MDETEKEREMKRRKREERKSNQSERWLPYPKMVFVLGDGCCSDLLQLEER